MSLLLLFPVSGGIVAAAGQAAGTSTAVGGGSLIIPAAGSASGVASAIGNSVVSAVGSSAGVAEGTSTATATAIIFAAAAGTASGTSVARAFITNAAAVPAEEQIGVILTPVGDLVEPEIDRIATEYRESPNLLALIRDLLGRAAEVVQIVHDIPEYFDLDTAVGDQLTLIGKRMGFPRRHCVCQASPVFGFDCGGYNGGLNIVGFCAPGSSWVNCGSVGVGYMSLDRDEVYRRYLYTRRYQMLGLYDITSLETGMANIWGDAARVVTTGPGTVVVTPGRPLTAEETLQIPIAFRVFPFAPGIKGFIHFGGAPIFGFGQGWAGFCSTPKAEWLCPSDPHAYDCAA